MVWVLLIDGIFIMVHPRKIDDVLLEHGGLPLAPCLSSRCPPELFGRTCRGDYSEPFLLFEFYFGTPPSFLKVMVSGGGGGWPTAFLCQP